MRKNPDDLSRQTRRLAISGRTTHPARAPCRPGTASRCVSGRSAGALRACCANAVSWSVASPGAPVRGRVRFLLFAVPGFVVTGFVLQVVAGAGSARWRVHHMFGTSSWNYRILEHHLGIERAGSATRVGGAQNDRRPCCSGLRSHALRCFAARLALCLTGNMARQKKLTDVCHSGYPADGAGAVPGNVISDHVRNQIEYPRRPVRKKTACGRRHRLICAARTT